MTKEDVKEPEDQGATVRRAQQETTQPVVAKASPSSGGMGMVQGLLICLAVVALIITLPKIMKLRRRQRSGLRSE